MPDSFKAFLVLCSLAGKYGKTTYSNFFLLRRKRNGVEGGLQNKLAYHGIVEEGLTCFKKLRGWVLFLQPSGLHSNTLQKGKCNLH